MTSLRMPFVVTIGSTALVGVACGGSAVIDPGGTGGAGTTSTSATSGGTTTNATSGTSSSTGTTVTTGPAPECPPPSELPNGYTLCDVPENVICTYDVGCQSGTVSLSFQCVNQSWQIQPQPCGQPYDSCPDTEYYCSGEWLMPQGTNPPSPCPNTLPQEGASCYAGGFGGVWEFCGYPCGDVPNAPWTVAQCNSTDPNMDGMWVHDGACD